ncbi:MAG TPA: tRNA 2-thiouridine(34) synthase MnmA [Bacteroidetes bacterium]|nr:MAG: tRNA 2-thiouridine(34) synthase MnmA [Rhodothermaeota bacterium MED-G64]HBD42960.1 tRNA 2-thiouridine(34) synthase MnmA [Bacteroidota bacterium]HBW00281.1 tRNA 2-thiouridine(34) synthase MnmA [Bacteroidota bacterium]|tara:strand:+ start:192 stop:1322 length:1131 start_codon:yes stop_codon:yes gene_type:complete
MSKKGRVLVAMSGGVDSSVAAVMLHQQGYEVIGITMKTWDYHRSGGKNGKETGCCTVESMNDARAIAVHRGFKHFIVDIRDEFGTWVIDRFIDDYMSGRTPNPCVLCNTHIKWAALLRRADQLDCEFIATGHYANVREEAGRYVISKGLDHSKDQSYALWGVRQEHLERTIFPVGSYRKSEIRAFAEEEGLLSVANKPDSYEICFIPDDNYRRFIQEQVDDYDERIGEGVFVDKFGKIVGTHAGYPNFTIGQRRGLHLPMGEPMYVTSINPDTNEVMVGVKEDLIQTTLTAAEMNLVKVGSLPEGEEVPIVGKIRYNDAGAEGTLEVTGQDEFKVHFPAGREAITPGQAVVCYDGEDVLAGGWIRKVSLESDDLLL